MTLIQNTGILQERAPLEGKKINYSNSTIPIYSPSCAVFVHMKSYSMIIWYL